VPASQPVTAAANAIGNGLWEVRAEPGDGGVQLLHGGRPVFGEDGLAVLTVEDPWGIWGDFNDSPESLSLTQVRQAWKVTRAEPGEQGPLRATLRVRLEAGRSRIDLTFALFSGRDAVDVGVRLFWDERCARLKLALPGEYTEATYDVLGGQVRRGALGEAPGGWWVKLHGPRGELGFASDALYGFNLTPRGDLQATVARATRHTADAPARPEEHFWRPVLDAGELRFRFLLAADLEALPRLAAELEEPPLAAPVTPSGGDWERVGSLLSISPDTVRLLALKPAEDGQGWILRLHSQEDSPVNVELRWLGRLLALPSLAPLELATFRLQLGERGRWKIAKTDLMETI
jgi:alpha-mannosidase